MKKYNKAEHDDLLRKFYEGETSLEDEKKLKDMTMRSTDAPEKDLLAFFDTERKAGPRPFPVEKLNSGHRFLFLTKIAASVALLFLFAFLMYNYVGDRKEQIQWVESTAAGVQKELVLPDGSKVTLNTESKLRYANPFDDRLVQLEGEAYFEVQADPARPFKVTAGRVTTEVLGTAFNLSWMPGAATAELEVKEGKVAFSSFGQDLNERIFVVAGERAVYDEQANTITKFESFDPNLLAWKTRQLVFQDMTVKQVLDHTQKYFQVEINADNVAIADCRFSGTFDNPAVEDILKAMEYVLGITYERNGDIITLKGGGC